MESNESKLHYMQISVDHMEMTKYLTNEQCGLLFKSTFAYFRGEKSEQDIENEAQKKHQIILPVFAQLKMSIDRGRSAYEERCAKNRENGRKGGAPKGNQNARKKKGNIKAKEESTPQTNEIEEDDTAEENEEIEVDLSQKEMTPEEKEKERKLIIKQRTNLMPYIITNVQKELSEYCTSLEKIFDKNQAIRFFSVFDICDWYYGNKFSLTHFYEKNDNSNYWGTQKFLLTIKEYNTTNEFLDELEKTQKNQFIIAQEKYYDTDEQYAEAFATFEQAATIAIEEIEEYKTTENNRTVEKTTETSQ